ncbi:MAG: RND family transporter [Rhodocyclaceae bacterium]|nr:MAG: RND family transporter [Rhodocyclaceae bacterium]
MESIAGEGSFVERLLFSNRKVIAIICALITALLGYEAFSVQFNSAYEKMLPVEHPYIRNYLANKAKLAGLGNTLRIAVENKKGSIIDVDYLETVKKINDEVFTFQGVDRPYMKSLWTPATRWTGVTEDGLDGGPVIPDDYDGSAGSLERIKLNIERSGEIGQLVAGDYRSSIILVPLQDSVKQEGGRIDYLDLSRRLEQLRAKYESDSIAIHITGFSKILGDLMESLQVIVGFFAIAIAICTAVLFWYTKCVRSTVLVVSCSMVAVVWLLGALSILGFELDPYSILVPFLVFAIGMSHGAQKMNGIMQDIGRGHSRLDAARMTFRRLFLAGATALVADAVGFAVLMVIAIPVIKDLAITASIGVAGLIFTNLVLLPILLSFSGVSLKAAKKSLEAEREDQGDKVHKKHPLWAFLDLFTARKWATRVICIAAVVGAIGFAISLGLKIGDTGEGAPELRESSRYNRDNAYIVEHYAASSDTYVIMVRTKQFHCADYETLVRVEALERELSQIPDVEFTNSLAALAKRTASGMNEGSYKWYEIPRTQDMLNNITSHAPRELFNQNCDLLTLYVYLRNHKADTLQHVVATFEKFATKNNTENIQFLSAAGNAGIDAATNIVVKQANIQMLCLVYVAVIVLAFVTFRSWRAVICAVVPLMLTSVLCEALMVSLNIGVKVATLPVIALGVGIGVDYALYILSVTLGQLRQGATLSEAYYKALIFTGRVVILTGVTLGVSVLTWAFSPIKFQADMGILLAFMFLWNMLGALVLVPALGHYLLKPARQPR